VRPVLASRDITVHAVYPRGIDTDMMTGVEAPKTSPAEFATGILEGLAADHTDTFPDPNSQTISQLWSSHPTSSERAFAEMAAVWPRRLGACAVRPLEPVETAPHYGHGIDGRPSGGLLAA
jgi:hypothetical protein